ncbi:hypothetical protein M0804_007266 [Polistes exclamans]|nr:hypothetical protein M0804_007266 [Polistes exclamans]
MGGGGGGWWWWWKTRSSKRKEEGRDSIRIIKTKDRYFAKDYIILISDTEKCSPIPIGKHLVNDKVWSEYPQD